MDAVGLDRTWVLASLATAPGAVMFAAMYPDRVDGLALSCPVLSGPLADDPDLTGWEPGEARRWAESWLEVAQEWGTGRMIDVWDPVLAGPSASVQLSSSASPMSSPSGPRM